VATAFAFVDLRRQHFLMATAFVGLHHQHCLVATSLLDECKGRGLRSPCGSLVSTLFVGRLHQLRELLLYQSCDLRQYCLGATEGVRSALSLIEVAFFLGTRVLTALSLGTFVTGILVTQARESGLAVLAPCCLAGEPDVKAAMAEPQKDCSCGLVDKLVAAGGLLLASASSSLLAGTSG